MNKNGLARVIGNINSSFSSNDERIKEFLNSLKITEGAFNLSKQIKDINNNNIDLSFHFSSDSTQTVYKYFDKYSPLKTVEKSGYFKKLPTKTTDSPSKPLNTSIYRKSDGTLTFNRSKAANVANKKLREQLFQFVAVIGGHEYIVPNVNKKIVYSNGKIPVPPPIDKILLTKRVDVKNFAQNTDTKYDKFDFEILKNRTIGLEEFVVSDYLLKKTIIKPKSFDYSPASNGKEWNQVMEDEIITYSLNAKGPVTSDGDKYKNQIYKLEKDIASMEATDQLSFLDKKVSTTFLVFEYKKNYFLNSKSLAKFIGIENISSNKIKVIPIYITVNGKIKNTIPEVIEYNKSTIITVRRKRKNE